MSKQSGSTLVVSLIFLTIITLVVVYGLEGSNLQSKMVANSLYTGKIFQECRNEQEANVTFYNKNAGENRTELLDIMTLSEEDNPKMGMDGLTKDTKRDGYIESKTEITINWQYIRDAPSFRGGYDLDSESQSKAYLFEHDCDAEFESANITTSQTLGTVVEGLESAGNIQ